MSPSPPKVSVVIPAHNVSAYIGRAIKSAQQQRGVLTETIVIDDCSTDDTVQVVRGLMSSDNHMTLLQTSMNGGPAVARNMGLDVAKGEWIAILDADDSMEPERLAFLLDIAKRHDATMVADNLRLVEEEDLQNSRVMISANVLKLEQSIDLAEFVEGNVGTPDRPRISFGFLKPLIRADFIRNNNIRYDEGLRFAEDFTLYVDCLQKGAKWWITPKAMYNYYVRAGSLTEHQSASDLNRLRTRQRALIEQLPSSSPIRLKRALKRHIAILDRDYSYRAFTDAVKAHDGWAAVSVLKASRKAGFYIVKVLISQAPVITRKFLRGGYSNRVS